VTTLARTLEARVAELGTRERAHVYWRAYEAFGDTCKTVGCISYGVVVLAAMRELAGSGSHGAHRLPLTDLTVAVAAQAAGLEALHLDRHFERLGTLLGVRAPWLAEPSA
jgi:hypothetical protein